MELSCSTLATPVDDVGAPRQASAGAAQPRSAPLIVFLHMPKAAGSTLNRLIDRRYAPGAVFQHDIVEQVHQGQVWQLPPERLTQYRVIRGHIPFEWVLRQWPGCTPACLTVLRDPVQRIRSFYDYLLHMPSHRQHARTRNGLTAFLDGDDVQLDNFQVRLLSGFPPWSCPKGDCPPEWLDAARRNLSERFVAVGVSECFDLFLAQLEHELGWPTRHYRSLNVSQGRARTRRIDPPLLSRIREMNRLDADLHAFARQLQQTAFAALSVREQARARRFARRQQVIRWLERFGPVNALADAIGRSRKSAKLELGN